MLDEAGEIHAKPVMRRRIILFFVRRLPTLWKTVHENKKLHITVARGGVRWGEGEGRQHLDLRGG